MGGGGLKELSRAHLKKINKFSFSCSGNRTSVASSTDTGDEHDTDIEDPTPLPPPRPRHWARRAKEQSMAPESKTGNVTEEESKPDDPSSPSDWSKSVPQFPLPTFQPTMQSKLQISKLVDKQFA